MKDPFNPKKSQQISWNDNAFFKNNLDREEEYIPSPNFYASVSRF